MAFPNCFEPPYQSKATKFVSARPFISKDVHLASLDREAQDKSEMAY